MNDSTERDLKIQFLKLELSILENVQTMPLINLIAGVIIPQLYLLYRPSIEETGLMSDALGTHTRIMHHDK